MGVIYKITNLINNKIYIGQTIMPEPVRWQQHIFWAYNDPSNDCIRLCNAIKKYGRENFKREILERADTKEALNEKEKFYIELYDSTNDKIGYNIEIGGNGHTKYSDEIIKEAFLETKSTTAVVKKININRSTLIKRLKAMGLFFPPTTIYQYNLSGDIINIFDSFSQAKKDTQLPLPNTVPPSHYSCGYAWIYKKEEEKAQEIIESIIYNDRIIKPILQYDLNGNFIKQWKSIADAGRSLNINISSIKAAIKGTQLTAGGYIWVKKDSYNTFEDKYKKYLLSPSCCQIEEIDKDGNILKIYDSSTKAEKELGFSYNDIKRVCDGEKKSTRGRFFRYSNLNKRLLIEFGLNEKL